MSKTRQLHPGDLVLVKKAEHIGEYEKHVMTKTIEVVIINEIHDQDTLQWMVTCLYDDVETKQRYFFKFIDQNRN